MSWESQVLAILAASLVRPFFLAGAALLLIRFLRVEHPASKHAIWTAVLIGMLVIPFAGIVAPRIEWHTLPARTLPVGHVLERIEVVAGIGADPVQTSAFGSDLGFSTAEPLRGAEENPQAAVSHRGVGISLRHGLLGLYLLGFIGFAAYRVFGWILLRRLVSRSRVVRAPFLRESEELTVPAAVGLFQPVIILPAGWREWSAEVKRAIYAHEFAHLRRKDPHISVLALAVQSLFWFHPLAWWLRRRISELAEMACDAAVLERTGDPVRYSRLLLEFTSRLAERKSNVRLPALAMAAGSGLSRRIDGVFALSGRRLRRLGNPVLVAILAGLPVLYITSTLNLRAAAVRPLLQLSARASADASVALRAPSMSVRVITSLAKVLLLAEPLPQQTAGATQDFLSENCVSCHNAQTHGGGLRLDDKDLTQIGRDAQVWEKVVRKLRSGLEPNIPAGPKRPDEASIRSAAEWIENEIDSNATPYSPAPGPHRLNRTEYRNAIQDLLGLDVDTALLLPPDESVQFFDNLVEALNPSNQERKEAFTTAAAKIAGMAMGSPSQSIVFSCVPANAGEESSCVQRIIRTLSSRAFRQPPSDAEVAALTDVYRSAHNPYIRGFNQNDFERGIESVLQSILSHPKFLNRLEAEPANPTAGETYRINDYELASRLSYFLWSRGPDDELINVAARGELHDPAILEQQTRRMLQDPRSEALATNFAGQWLNLRLLRVIGPFSGFGEFDEPLRQAMRRETELFFDSIVHEDRNVKDLLDADYTFLNERLARHYGIPNITGTQFRRVTLGSAFDVRRGLLGKAAFLTVTSRSDRESITTRGKWVLMTLLGAFPPDPPPNIPPFASRTPGATNGPTLRQMMDTAMAVRWDCANCHRLMDPYGLALENFDGIGMWRTRDAGLPVDASTELLDGTRLNGPADLRRVLLNRSDQFVQTLTLRLLTYGLGRTTNYRDMPLVRSIARGAAAENYKFSAIILGIVKSAPFQMNTRR